MSPGRKVVLVALGALVVGAAHCSSDPSTDAPPGAGAGGTSPAGGPGGQSGEAGSGPSGGTTGAAGTGGTGTGGTGTSTGGTSSGGTSSGGTSSGGTSSGGGGGGGSPKHANIVFVLADDFSMNLLQYMPNVVKMQKQGVTFANHFVTDSLCCPSRTSIFTGQFPHLSGVFTNGGNDGGFATFNAKGNAGKTFAVALSGAGYKTAMMGKYLNGYSATDDGPPMGWSQWDVADDGYHEFNYNMREDAKVVAYGKTDKDYLTDVVAGLGSDFITAAAKGNFALEVATFAPHAPYTPPTRYANDDPDLKLPRTPAFGARPEKTDPKWLQAVPKLSQKQIDNMDEDFRNRVRSVHAIDDLVVSLQKALVATGHDKDTYIFFSSDNGYHMGDHSLTPGKQTAFDTDIHVPLVVVGPGVPAGVTVDAMTENIDFCGTFAEIAGAAAPPTSVGHSLMPWLTGQKPADWRDAVLIEHHGYDFDASDPDAQPDGSGNPTTYEALRTADEVYVEYDDGEKEYHDHNTDPNELHNTVGSLPAAKAASFHTALQAARTCTDPASCWAAQHMPK